MKYLKVVQCLLLISFGALGVVAQEVKYPPTSEYLMPSDAEIALAKSAAPDNISGRATIKVPNRMRSAYLTLRMESDVEAERVFSALSDGGRVLMPIQETFFASRFGKYKIGSALSG